MKKTVKIVSIILIIVLVATLFSACGGNEKKKIGIIKFGNHESLNDCLKGIQEGLKESGINSEEYEIEVLDSNFDASTSASQANNLKNQNVELIGAIATPSAISAAKAVKGRIPVVYCAVSDPVSAGLTEMENVTGSSDVLDFDGQVKLIKSILPNVNKIGVLYSVNEPNSLAQLRALKEITEPQGIEIVEQSITQANEIITASNTLISKGIDCLTNFTDNTVVGLITDFLPIMTKANIPVFGSEIQQVVGYDITIDGKEGMQSCLASASLDYVALGKSTGLLMAKVLKGEEIEKGSFIKVEDSFFCYNSKMAEQLGLEINLNVDGKTLENVAE